MFSDEWEWDAAAEELTWDRVSVKPSNSSSKIQGLRRGAYWECDGNLRFQLLGLDGSLVFLEHVFWVVSLNTLFILVFGKISAFPLSIHLIFFLFNSTFTKSYKMV